MELAAIPEARRAQRQFRAANQSSVDRDGNEDVGFADVVVIEEIFGAGFEIVGIERPAANGNRDAELCSSSRSPCSGKTSDWSAVLDIRRAAGRTS